MSDSFPEPLIAAYFDGTLDAAEAERVQAFLEETPGRRGFMAGVRAAFRGEDIAVPAHDAVTAGHLLMARLRAEYGHQREGNMRGAMSQASRGWSARSAGRSALGTQPLRQGVWYALTGVIIGALGIMMSWNGVKHRVVGHTPLAVATYMTTNGQRATITLLDGTTIMLNVASRLEVPADFAANHRTVYLTGEALFTVSHHDGTLFTVVSGATTARVLGTSFLVRHYPTDTTTTVVVSDGKVAVGNAIVTADRLVEVERDGVSHLHVADASMFRFATGLLALRAMPLSAAIPELDRWYNADIRLGDPQLGMLLIKGEFTAGSLSDLAEVLELTFAVRVVRDARVLTLFPQVR